MKLSAIGTPRGLTASPIARVTRRSHDPAERSLYYRVLEDGTAPGSPEEIQGYLGVLVAANAPPWVPPRDVPVISGFRDLSFLEEDAIVKIGASTGRLRVLYRPSSAHNALLVTSACNNRCIMCSQPPTKEPDDPLDEQLRVIDLISGQPESLAITGGEPTLLKEGLFTLLARLRDRLPHTAVHLLTNGRLYAYEDYVRHLSEIAHPHFTSAIPLYADVAPLHDAIVGAPGAFDQAVHGLYNAAKYALSLEIRVVLQRPTIRRLPQLAEFIYRNFPFVNHIAFMGLENMGYAVKNWDTLWVDPVEYAPTLEACVRSLFVRRMSVSLYNLQLCTLPRSLWWFARKSISEYKSIYVEECVACGAKDLCGGLFASTKRRHSAFLHPIRRSSAGPPLLSPRLA